MVNTKELKRKIAERGLKIRFLADKLGITYASLNGKVHGRFEFKASEIATLSRILALTHEEVFAIFFTQTIE